MTTLAGSFAASEAAAAAIALTVSAAAGLDSDFGNERPAASNPFLKKHWMVCPREHALIDEDALVLHSRQSFSSGKVVNLAMIECMPTDWRIYDATNSITSRQVSRHAPSHEQSHSADTSHMRLCMQACTIKVTLRGAS